jgi:flagellar protein FlaI
LANLRGILERLRRSRAKRKPIKLGEPAPAEEGREAPGTPERVEAPLRFFPGLSGDFKPIKTYPLEEPWSRAVILQNTETGETIYWVDEIPLNDAEREVYKKIIDVLYWEMEPPKEGVDPQEHFIEEAKKVINKYMLRFGETVSPLISWRKIQYYVIRDTVGFGPLEPLMKDENIEDISCDGVGRPIYVWHREYESIPTNIVFKNENELDAMIVRLAHKAGKHVSVAFPIVDAILPGGHRLAATYKREVSMAGSTFTIRKFREKPLSVIDLIRHGSISPELGAYFWLAMEFKQTGLIMGVTGAGKTTMLNALATLFRPTIKVVTIEDTPELKLTLENWVQLVSRPSYGMGPEKIGEITLYDLVKVSLRYRPDVIIVGEVRGEEAYVLFQAISTGHGGLTTIHAEHIDAAVKRLTSPPMNIPESYIPLVNFALVVKRVRLYNPDGTYKIARRVTDVWEVWDYGDYRTVARWNAATRRHEVDFSNSRILRSIADQVGTDYAWVVDELERRATVLRWMAAEAITDYREVAKIVNEYYAAPGRVYERARSGLRGMKAYG